MSTDRGARYPTSADVRRRWPLRGDRPAARLCRHRLAWLGYVLRLRCRVHAPTASGRPRGVLPRVWGEGSTARRLPPVSRARTRLGLDVEPDRHRASVHVRSVSPSSWRRMAYPLTGQAPCLSLIHISEPTRLGMISYAVFCL